jgi:hypothetical protein
VPNSQKGAYAEEESDEQDSGEKEDQSRPRRNLRWLIVSWLAMALVWFGHHPVHATGSAEATTD